MKEERKIETLMRERTLRLCELRKKEEAGKEEERGREGR